MLKRVLISLFIILQVSLFSGESSIIVIDWVNSELSPLAKESNVTALTHLVNEDAKKHKNQIESIKTDIAGDISNLLSSEAAILRLYILDQNSNLIVSYPEGTSNVIKGKAKQVGENAISSGQIQVTPTFFDNDSSMFVIIAATPIKSGLSQAGAIGVVLDAATFESK